MGEEKSISSLLEKGVNVVSKLVDIISENAGWVGGATAAIGVGALAAHSYHKREEWDRLSATRPPEIPEWYERCQDVFAEDRVRRALRAATATARPLIVVGSSSDYTRAIVNSVVTRLETHDLNVSCPVPSDQKGAISGLVGDSEKKMDSTTTVSDSDTRPVFKQRVRLHLSDIVDLRSWLRRFGAHASASRLQDTVELLSKARSVLLSDDDDSRPEDLVAEIRARVAEATESEVSTELLALMAEMVVRHISRDSSHGDGKQRGLVFLDGLERMDVLSLPPVGIRALTLYMEYVCLIAKKRKCSVIASASSAFALDHLAGLEATGAVLVLHLDDPSPLLAQSAYEEYQRFLPTEVFNQMPRFEVVQRVLGNRLPDLHLYVHLVEAGMCKRPQDMPDIAATQRWFRAAVHSPPSTSHATGVSSFHAASRVTAGWSSSEARVVLRLLSDSTSDRGSVPLNTVLHELENLYSSTDNRKEDASGDFDVAEDEEDIETLRGSRAFRALSAMSRCDLFYFCGPRVVNGAFQSCIAPSRPLHHYVLRAYREKILGSA